MRDFPVSRENNALFKSQNIVLFFFRIPYSSLSSENGNKIIVSLQLVSKQHVHHCSGFSSMMHAWKVGSKGCLSDQEREETY